MKNSYQNHYRWVALGDSLTLGYGALPQQSYPARVIELSHETGSPLKLVKNLANGGHTLAKVQLLQMTRLFLYHPDIVTLWAGTNDALLNAATGKTFDLASRKILPTPAEDFRQRLEQVVKKLFQKKVKQIFVGKIHDLWRIPIAQDWAETKKAAIQTIVQSYNESIAQISDQYPDVFVVSLDKVRELYDPQNYLNDGIHPRPQVYAMVAEAWWQEMAPQLGSPLSETSLTEDGVDLLPKMAP